MANVAYVSIRVRATHFERWTDGRTCKNVIEERAARTDAVVRITNIGTSNNNAAISEKYHFGVRQTYLWNSTFPSLPSPTKDRASLFLFLRRRKRLQAAAIRCASTWCRVWGTTATSGTVQVTPFQTRCYVRRRFIMRFTPHNWCSR